MISNHQYAHTTLVPEPNSKPIVQNSDTLQRQQSQARKQKHWLLDSDRFDLMLHNQAAKDVDSESNMMQSDTVIFEKDQSSLHGTPPKISQKINQKQLNVKTGGDALKYEENINSRQERVQIADESLQHINDSSRMAMMTGQDQKMFGFTEESYNEINDARQNAYVARLLLPLENTEDIKKTVHRLIKNLTK